MSRKQDIGKRDVEQLARALRLQLPKGWVIATGWTLCLERAHELAEAYRQPPLPIPAPGWCTVCMQRECSCTIQRTSEGYPMVVPRIG